MKGTGTLEEFRKSTRGTREAGLEHMRGTTGRQMMYRRGTTMNNRGPTPNRECVISKGLSVDLTEASEAYEFMRETTVGLITRVLTDLSLCYNHLKLNRVIMLT